MLTPYRSSSDEIGLTLEESAAYRASLSMPKHDRSPSTAEVSRETTENLYDLGLLNRPPSKSRTTPNDPKTAHCKTSYTLLLLLHTPSRACFQDLLFHRQKPRDT